MARRQRNQKQRDRSFGKAKVEKKVVKLQKEIVLKVTDHEISQAFGKLEIVPKSTVKNKKKEGKAEDNLSQLFEELSVKPSLLEKFEEVRVTQCKLFQCGCCCSVHKNNNNGKLMNLRVIKK